jgi:hypothetical protein
MRNHPIVDRKRTTYVALGESLGIDESAARRRYRHVEQTHGSVTLHRLQKWDRDREQLAQRDAAIKREQRCGYLLRESGEPRELTPQRIHQIAREAR